MSPARVILHLPERYEALIEKRRRPLLYTRILDMIAARGGTALIGPRHPPRAPDGDLHITDNARAPGPGGLSAATAYLEDFWHLDPEGVLAGSSIRHETFRPRAVEGAAARAFVRGLRARFVAPRRGRYGQKRALERFPKGALAVFLQGPAPYRAGQAFCEAEVMVRTVLAGAEGRPVIVKAHPLALEEGRALIARLRAEGALGAQMIETDANIHDILAACAATISVNSAAAIEGFLHGKPALLFGQSDFAQAAVSVREPGAFGAALAQALGTDWPHVRFLYWYFGLHCLWLEDPDLETKILAIFARAGFDARRLGLAP